MLRTCAVTIALSLAAGTAGAANLKSLSADCDPSLAVSVGLGINGKICTAATKRSDGGQVKYGAPDGAFYPLGKANGVVFDEDPAFMRASRNGNARADAAVSRASGNRNGASGTRANGRGQGAAGGFPPSFAGNGGGSGEGGPGAPFDLVSGPPQDAETLLPTASAVSPSPIPLPAAGWLLLGGLGALGLIGRRRA